LSSICIRLHFRGRERKDSTAYREQDNVNVSDVGHKLGHEPQLTDLADLGLKGLLKVVARLQKCVSTKPAKKKKKITYVDKEASLDKIHLAVQVIL